MAPELSDGSLLAPTVSLPDVARQLAQDAERRGFVVAWAPAALPETWTASYREWIAKHRNAGIGRLARGLDVRLTVQQRFGWVRSVMIVAAPHAYSDPGLPPGTSVTGRVARRFWVREPDPFALKLLLQPHLDAIKKLGRDLGVRTRDYVDQGPLPVNLFAVLSGLAWRGRNAMPNTVMYGTRLTLACLLTDIDLPVTPEPSADHCGTCRQCTAGCPTGALLPDRTVDLNLCTSYWTTAHEGMIPVDRWASIGDWVFGCDICQDVCPWNIRAQQRHEIWKHYTPEPILAHLPLTDPLVLAEPAFATKYAGSAFARAGRGRVARNALIVLTNRGDQDAVPVVRAAARDVDPLVRATAAHALARFGDRREIGLLLGDPVSMVRAAALEAQAD